MNRTWTRIVVAIMAVGVVLLMTETSTAQRRTRREARGVAMNKAQVKAVINRVEDRVDNFVKNYDKSLDRSRLDGSSRENWLMNRARDLETATDELAREFDRRDAWVENREETRRCLNIATDIDRNMRLHRFGAATEANWANVRFELNTLADIYNMPRVGANVYR
jgi:Na+/phosphate symporter